MPNNERKVPYIIVPKWMEKEQPAKAEFCHLINFALDGAPDMSLAEFATLLCEANKSSSLERLGFVVEEQLKEVSKKWAR